MGRKFSILPTSEPSSGINITPLVDIVLVMLIIFMVVPPSLEKNLGVQMPTVSPDPAPAPASADQLVIKVAANGELAINEEKVSSDAYVGKLGEILQHRRAEDRVVVVAADDVASYGHLVAAIDGAKQAGAGTVGMLTEARP